MSAATIESDRPVENATGQLASGLRAGVVPIFVDLDDCLVRTDTLHESIALLLRRKPWILFCLMPWLLRGRHTLKSKLAGLGIPSAELLPYCTTLIEFLRQQAGRGRPIVLATAAHEKIAHAVAAHLGIFTAVLATSSKVNLKGRRKLAAIEELCRHHGWARFAYVGDSVADLPIWSASAETYLVESNAWSYRLLSTRVKPAAVFPRARPPRPPVFAAMRLHHWAKNILVFAPLIAGHELNNVPALARALLAFLAFGLTASAVYVWNDLFDIEHDRRHPTKRLRPFAAGTLPVRRGVLLATGLMGCGVGLAGALLPGPFTLALVAYAGLTFAYSLWLKQKLLADVMTLALLYTIRIVAGGLALGIVISHWMAAFSVFLFTSLAFAKRYSELRRAAAEQPQKQLQGRGYMTADLPVVQNAGVTCGCIAVLVLALYLNSEQVTHHYSQPQLLWILCLGTLYWVVRIWFFAARGTLPEDPIVFALHDRTSFILAFICGCAVAAAWLL